MLPALGHLRDSDPVQGLEWALSMFWKTLGGAGIDSRFHVFMSARCRLLGSSASFVWFDALHL